MEKQKDQCDSKTRGLSQRDKLKKSNKLVRLTNLDVFLEDQ